LFNTNSELIKLLIRQKDELIKFLGALGYSSDAPEPPPVRPEPEPPRLRPSQQKGVDMNDLLRSIPKARVPRGPNQQSQPRWNGYYWHY
jgi:hypothetical protein